MPKFGKKSLERLEELHPDLQLLMNELIKEMDVTILCGYRGKDEQNSAFINGKSRLQFPRSKHNTTPSQAVDIAPISPKTKGIDWNDIALFLEMCSKVEKLADTLNIKIRLGRDFSFKDYVHFELSDKHKKGKF
jgi:peptidoglycan L-alanyl-D-glutamate endopeptidase CwlK